MIRRSVQGAVALSLLVLVVFANAMDGTFHYDDFHSLVHNPHVRDLRQLPALFAEPTRFSADLEKAMFRPLVLTSYAANYLVGGESAAGYLVGNLLLHLGCALLVWRIARRLGWGGEAGALAAAALFAVHPVVSEPVNYVSSRSESMAALFLLGSLLAYVRSRREPVGVWRWVSLALFASSLLTKATGMSLLLVVLALEICRPGGVPWQTRGRRLLPYAIVGTAYVALLYLSGLLPVGEGGSPVRGASQQAATQLKAVGHYLHLLVMPVAQSVDPPFVEGRVGEAAVWGGAALLASWIGLAVAATAGRQRWWLLMPLLVVLPASAMPLNVLVNEHRVYLSVVGFAVLVVGVFDSSYGRRWPAVALLVICCLLTVQRNEVWATEMSLWRDAVQKGPYQARGRVHLGTSMRKAGDLDGAREQFETAVRLEPGNLAARTNLATTMYEQALGTDGAGSTLRAAATHYQHVLMADPKDREALTNLGNTRLALGDTAAAVAAYGRAAEAHPNYAAAFANLAQIGMAQGDYASAVTYLERVVRIEPAAAAGYRELGQARAGLGDLPGSLDAFRRACQLDPTDGTACYNFGEIAFELGGQAQATGRSRQARALWQEAEHAYADLLSRFGDYRLARQRLEELRPRLGGRVP